MVPLLSSIGLQAASHAKAAFSTTSFSNFEPIRAFEASSTNNAVGATAPRATLASTH